VPKLKQIAIDVDVNRAIENQRRSFSESENDILRRILLPITPETRPPRPKATAPDTASAIVTRSRGQWTVEILGERRPAANLQDAYRRLLLHFHARRPDFLQKFSLEKGRSRRFVARKPSDLYLKSPHLASDHAKELTPGWYFDTNLSMEQVASRARVAARLCGLHYGTDVRILENLREI
jgi:negative regulator of replication initiation